jgi:alpha,alpha-trehalose phosphorylase
MIARKLIELPEHIYPREEWRMVEKQFYPRYMPQTETLFTTANGYFGMRGCCEEGRPVYQSGTLINGFYESWPITYGEEAYGFAKTGQTIVNVTDAKVIKLYVNDEPFYLPTADLLAYERALNMKEGTLDREIIWETPSGKRVSIKSRRLVSLEHRHLAAISYEVTVLNGEAPVVLSSEICKPDQHQADDDDPRSTRGFEERVLMPVVYFRQDRRIVLGHRTRNSGMTLACGIDHVLETRCTHDFESRCSQDAGKVVFSIQAKPEEPILLTKFITYQTSRSRPPEELCERAEQTLNRACGYGFNELLAGQKKSMGEFWRTSDVQVEGDTSVQQAIRFNLFHILQASARAEGAGIPAKGLTGSGYEGHYFWDTEIYVLPFLIYTAPRVARNLLRFRHSMLDKARQRACEVNQKGALFPWRTISGDEASTYYAAGTAQYHINADIIYAMKKYVDATCDRSFLHGPGVEMLVETARLWQDLGFYSDRKNGKFCIQGVTGPDEYNTVVNNNTFTNLMARENLWYAAATVEALQKDEPKRYTALVHETGLNAGEAKEWKRAADHMYVPYDREAGIHLQDDQFLDREPWDLENTPGDKFPLLLHHHPLVINRHRVIKQADVVLALFLLGNEFSLEEKRKNFYYYDPLTTGDSSLSVCIQAIVAVEFDDREKFLQYMRYALLMDLADVGGNVKDGCHIASMGGTWMALVYGGMGFRDFNGEFTFRPRQPRRQLTMRCRLTLRGMLLQVENSPKGVTYTLCDGDEISFRHEEEEIRLTRRSPTCKRPHCKSQVK